MTLNRAFPRVQLGILKRIRRFLARRIQFVGLIALLPLLCVLTIGLRSHPNVSYSNPITISFLGFTNMDDKFAGSFVMTNRSASQAKIDLEMYGYSRQLRLYAGGNSTWKTHLSCCDGLLGGNQSVDFQLSGGTKINPFTYRSVLVTKIPRPEWQQKTIRALDSIGLHLCRDANHRLTIKLGGGAANVSSLDRLYITTNVWNSN